MSLLTPHSTLEDRRMASIYRFLKHEFTDPRIYLPRLRGDTHLIITPLPNTIGVPSTGDHIFFLAAYTIAELASFVRAAKDHDPRVFQQFCDVMDEIDPSFPIDRWELAEERDDWHECLIEDAFRSRGKILDDKWVYERRYMYVRVLDGWRGTARRATPFAAPIQVWLLPCTQRMMDELADGLILPAPFVGQDFQKFRTFEHADWRVGNGLNKPRINLKVANFEAYYPSVFDTESYDETERGDNYNTDLRFRPAGPKRRPTVPYRIDTGITTRNL